MSKRPFEERKQDYLRIMEAAKKKGGRYDKAGYFRASSPAEAAMALQKAGYATDPYYADSLIKVMLDEDHTYLVINDGTGAEIVKAYSFGNEVKIERGQDGTSAKTFPSGACVKWEVTKQGMTETVYNSDFKCCDFDEDCCCKS